MYQSTSRVGRISPTDEPFVLPYQGLKCRRRQTGTRRMWYNDTKKYRKKTPFVGLKISFWYGQNVRRPRVELNIIHYSHLLGSDRKYLREWRVYPGTWL